MLAPRVSLLPRGVLVLGVPFPSIRVALRDVDALIADTVAVPGWARLRLMAARIDLAALEVRR